MSIQKRLLSLTGKRLLLSTPKKEELNMKKQLTFLLLLLTLIVPVSAQAPTVALTFDDGPSGRFTAALLDGLQKREVKATFFLCGYPSGSTRSSPSGLPPRAMKSAAMGFPTTPWRA